MSEVPQRWFPVARAEEVTPRLVVQVQVLGREIVLWRDDAGRVNAWENRCPHRGVRLSIGLNTGTELRCRYHGWRFATGTGYCTHIPAHPGQKPAAAIRATRYGCVEQHHFVWVNLSTDADPEALPALTTTPVTTLRSVFVEAPAADVAQALGVGYRFSPDPNDVDAPLGDTTMLEHDAYIVTATVAVQPQVAVTFLLQPVSASQCVIHGFVHAASSALERIALLRHHHSRLTLLRDAVERTADAVR